MGSYQHLSLVERAKIKTLQLQNFSLRAIGKALGRNHTTVSRELERNHQGHPMMSGYVPELADALSENRKSGSSKESVGQNQPFESYLPTYPPEAAQV